MLVIAAASYPGNTRGRSALPAATSAPAQTGVGNSAPHRDHHRGARDHGRGAGHGQVTVVAERACYVTVYEGEGTKGRVLFSDTLDPDTKLSR